MADKMSRKERKAQKAEEARELHELRRQRLQKQGQRGRVGGPPGMPAEKAKDFKGTCKKLIKFLGRHKFGILMVWIFAIASTIFSIIGPKILGMATTELFNGLVSKIQGTGAINFEAIGKILAITMGIYCISAFCNWVQAWVMASLSQRVGFEMRAGISEKIHKLPLKFFETRTTGEVLSRITNDVDTLTMSLNLVRSMARLRKYMADRML